MSTRSDQKTRLKSILETIIYNAQALSVLDSYTNNSNSYPYFYILSGDMRIDSMSNRVYREHRTYYINCAFSVNQAVVATPIDDVESLIIEKLRTLDTRDGQLPIWQDIYIKDVSSPYQDDVAHRDNIVIKTITVECETEPLLT
jgi:hypothetical protein